MQTVDLALFTLACGVAALVTGWIRRLALRHGVLDRPNERSSHTLPTPRGGGVGIVVAFVGAVTALVVLGRITLELYAAIAGGGVLVAAVGAWDDRWQVRASRRALVHVIAAAWSLWWIRDGQLWNPLVVVEWVGLVWMINLYNFMDGIDGIAGGEAVFVGAAGAALLGSSAPPLSATAMLLASASLGFLVWNFPRARIFMGDVASGFLGLVLGVLALGAVHTDASSYWPWLILLGAFEVDATVTLMRRFARRERVTAAHRSHAYQHASRRLGSHVKVTLAVAAVNVAWLLPWAWAAHHALVPGLLATVIALLPLGVVALVLRAGVD